MPSPFSRTVRSLSSDRFSRSFVGLLAVAAILAGWLVWSLTSRVTVYEATSTARLEVDSAVHPIEAAVSGRVVKNYIALGREVQLGEALVELEADAERLQLPEEESRVAALSAQFAALCGQMAAERQAQTETQQSAPAALDEAQARYDEALATAGAAKEQAKRLASLYRQGLIAELDMIHAIAEADRRLAAAEALRSSITRQDNDLRALASTKQAALENLNREAAVLTGEIKTRTAIIERLKHEIHRRIIRAPASGRLGETASLQAGQFVREGDKLGAIIPEGRLRAIAEFAPSSALGRIQAGQRARLRLEGFPWTEFGQLEATVSLVASEPRQGIVRVELIVHPESAPLIHLQHGLPGQVEIAVERASPAELALRAAGRLLMKKPQS
ncbi:MAG TPA: HlyD family efflux transporter periplasmic adaptor subunit [Blastocatellia bacterium]|nr:HlyD family efflux transporter periplasmic adaptor subunit [Blastocatellia bacterium]